MRESISSSTNTCYYLLQDYLFNCVLKGAPSSELVANQIIPAIYNARDARVWHTRGDHERQISMLELPRKPK